MEPRLLLSSVTYDDPNAPDGSPLPADVVPVVTQDPTGASATFPLSSVPQLHSNPSAPAAIYLDFVGAPAQSWGGYNATATPAFDQDGDPTTFSGGELAAVQEIWARVAEKYAPFNLDVTTVAPASLVHYQNMEIVIGGTGAWTGGGYGGLSYTQAFSTPFEPNISWVFSVNLGNARAPIAEAAAHEAGHEFGLNHQGTHDANGAQTNAYNPGNSLIAPVMGNSYGAQRGLWWNGTSSISATTIQDDMAVISSATNGFGYRPQDHGQSIAAANPLSLSGTSVSGSGVIEKTTDADYFSFATGSGAVTLDVNVPQYGATLHATAQLFDSAGSLIATAANANTLAQSITATLAAGTYYLAVESYGQYGDLGQYSVTGTVAPRPTPITLAESSDHLHINWTQGAASGQILIGDANGLTFSGDGYNDPITLDYTSGNPLPRILHLSGTFTINGLQGTNPLANTALEIGRSTVFISYAGPASDPIAAIYAYVQSGYNNGAWTGTPTASTGVITSAAAAANARKNTDIGFADFGDGSDVNTTPNTIELKYTLAGDTNLNGTVDVVDLNNLLGNYNRSGNWTRGDSTYNGTVDVFDLHNLLANYQTTLGSQVAPAPPTPTNSPGPAPSPGAAGQPPKVTQPGRPKIGLGIHSETPPSSLRWSQRIKKHR